MRVINRGEHLSLFGQLQSPEIDSGRKLLDATC